MNEVNELGFLDENRLGQVLGTYAGAEVEYLDGSTDGTVYGKFDVLFLGARLGPVNRIDLGMNEGPELGFSDVKGVVSKIGMCDGAELGYLDGSTDGTVDGKFDGLLLGSRLGSDEDL